MAIVQRINRDGTIRFQVRVKDRNGKWFPTPAFADLASAEGHESELKKQKRKGAKVMSGDAIETTVSEYWSVWSVENRTDTSEGWKLSQDQMYRDYIEPEIGSVMLGHVGPPEIGRVLRKMRDSGRGAQTRLHVYNLLNKMFGDAVTYYDMLASNPVKKDFHRPKVKETQAEFLRPEQAWSLLECSKSHYAAEAIWLSTLGGLRYEAVAALQWKSVLWDADQILICRAWKKKVQKIEEFPKGGDWEYAPMVAPLRDFLSERWSKCQDGSALVCHGPQGGMLKYEAYLEAVGRLCKEAGIPRMTPHGLRHSCTELFTREGASAEDIRRLLNQKSLSATKRYIHRTDDRLRSIAEKVMPFRVIDGGNQAVGNSKSFPNGK